MTKPETFKDVLHFCETRLLSLKKNAVAATKAMEMNQKETPTRSSGLRLVAASGEAESVAAWLLSGKRASIETAPRVDLSIRELIFIGWGLFVETDISH